MRHFLFMLNFIFAICFLFPAHAYSEDAPQDGDKKMMAKTRVYAPHVIEDGSETAVTESEAITEKKPEKEMTPEEKIWAKYKDLAAGTATEEQTSSQKTINRNEDKTEQKKAEKKTSSGSSAGDLSALLESYKNKTSSGGKMNSRSYRSSDDDDYSGGSMQTISNKKAETNKPEDSDSTEKDAEAENPSKKKAHQYHYEKKKKPTYNN